MRPLFQAHNLIIMTKQGDKSKENGFESCAGRAESKQGNYISATLSKSSV